MTSSWWPKQSFWVEQLTAVLRSGWHPVETRAKCSVLYSAAAGIRVTLTFVSNGGCHVHSTYNLRCKQAEHDAGSFFWEVYVCFRAYMKLSAEGSCFLSQKIVRVRARTQVKEFLSTMCTCFSSFWTVQPRKLRKNSFPPRRHLECSTCFGSWGELDP